MSKSTTILLAAVGLLVFGSPACAVTADFLGVWVNVDCETGGITKLVITPTGVDDRLRIRTFGKCTPTDCDWGTEDLHLYGASISDTDYQFATAIYDKGFVETILTLEYKDDGRLSLEGFDRFNRGDRSNFHYHEDFRKVGEGEGRCPDLVIENIARPEWDNANHRSIIRAVITNVGTANAGESLARLIDPSTPQSTGAPYNDVQSVPALGPGDSHTVIFTLPYWVYNPNAELEVTADYKGQIPECDENNNSKSFFELG